MAIYKIVGLENNILREKAKTVPKITTNVLKLLDNMRETLYAAKGVGLAAPQVGVLKRVIVIDAGEGLLELINPEIVEFAGQAIDAEGCLSIPDAMGDVPRAAIVKVKYQDRQGREKFIRADSLLARALQHEIDHLDGVLMIDRAIKVWKIKI